MSLSIPATRGGQKWAKPACRPKATKAMRLVTLKNASDVEVRWYYRNDDNEEEEYVLYPKQEMDVEAKIMWHVLGDPDLRPGQTNPPTFGTVKTWEVVITNLQHRFGAWLFDKSHYNGPGELPGRVVYDESSVYEAIRRGLIYCPELVHETGLKGTDYYSGAERVNKPKHVSMRDITPDEPGGGRGPRAARVSSKFIEEDEMIAVRRDAKNAPALAD